MGHERFESAAVFGRNVFEAAVDGLAELGEGGVVFSV